MNPIETAARAIAGADALFIGAGAGMGVDSGLPDFRGDEGFWKAYPPFRGKKFHQISTPHWFTTDPAQAWGFFGHRMHLYRRTVPHAGFAILKKWAERRPAFVYTSNVDGQFQKAGFADDQIYECHGSIHHLQCAGGCRPAIWPADGVQVDVDEQSIRARGDLPKCPVCGALARPNVLMFSDSGWINDRTDAQGARVRNWSTSMADRRVVAIEMGAGLAIPTVRWRCERFLPNLIRINPREADNPGGISIAMGSLEALTQIDAMLADDHGECLRTGMTN